MNFSNIENLNVFVKGDFKKNIDTIKKENGFYFITYKNNSKIYKYKEDQITIETKINLESEEKLLDELNTFFNNNNIDMYDINKKRNKNY